MTSILAPIPFQWLARCDYKSTLLQLKHQASMLADTGHGEIIWTCEHHAVYTTGRRAMDNRIQHKLPAPLLITDRGGETTYHGPGQIMLYPIIHVRQRGLSVRQYIHILEQSAINLLASLGIQACRQTRMPGVWVPEGKIAAIGIRIARGVAYHGMALNICVDMSYFDAINPCGLGKKAANLQHDGTPKTDLSELALAWSRSLNACIDEAAESKHAILGSFTK